MIENQTNFVGACRGANKLCKELVGRKKSYEGNCRNLLPATSDQIWKI